MSSVKLENQINVIGENLEWYEFNSDADALVIDKDGEFKMESYWSYGQFNKCFWKNHLLVQYPKP